MGDANIQKCQVHVIYSMNQKVTRGDGNTPAVYKADATHFAQGFVSGKWKVCVLLLHDLSHRPMFLACRAICMWIARAKQMLTARWTRGTGLCDVPTTSKKPCRRLQWRASRLKYTWEGAKRQNVVFPTGRVHIWMGPRDGGLRAETSHEGTQHQRAVRWNGRRYSRLNSWAM